MSIQTETRGEALIIRPGGNFNKMAADELHELLDSAIAEGATRLVFDFSMLPHISSDGLRVILKAIGEVQGKKGQIVATQMCEQVRGVFTASGFFSLIKDFDDIESALEAVNRVTN